MKTAILLINEDGAYKDGDVVTIGGIITGRRNKTTKNNTQMAFLTFEDLHGSLDVIVFPKVYERYSPVMAVDSIVFTKDASACARTKHRSLCASR